jgi:glycosyltransferase involved in cell wall biosynthesis
MIIAVHIRQIEQQHDYYQYILELVSELAEQHPEHQFIIIGNAPLLSKTISGQNISWVHQKAFLQSPVLWKVWYQLRLPLLLHKQAVDILLCVDSIAAGMTKVPQVLIIKDLGFLNAKGPGNKVQSGFWKRSFPRTLEKVNSIIVLSEGVRTAIENKYSLHNGKMHTIIPTLLNPVTALAEEEKQAVKDRFTEGREYFIHHCTSIDKQKLTFLLKAFSVFKKRQRSAWKLVLTNDPVNPALQELLSTYKYKEDIVVQNRQHKNELMASAYAMIFTDAQEGFMIDVQKCMSLGIPIIAPSHSVAQEVGKDASLYYNDDSYEAVAEALMTLYKDENTRNQLILRGKQLTAGQDKDIFLQTFWEKVIKTKTT